MNQPESKTHSASGAPFEPGQLAMLDALMDLLIPASRDRRMPSARSLALYADASRLPARDRVLFDSGLAELEARAIRAHGSGFARLDPAPARALVDALRAEGSPFIQTFMTQTVGRYLSHDVVMPLIGLEPRPLWPKGNVVTEGDWSLIDVVRKRPKIYRPV